MTASRDSGYVGEAQRPEIPSDEKHSQDESSVTDAVNDEGLGSSIAGGLAMEIKSNQQVRTQTHAFPADKQQDIVVGQDQGQHGKHEEVEVSEESVIAAFMRHVSGRVNMNQHAD